MTLTESRKRELRAAGLIYGVTLAVYLPALRNGFVWDDDAYVTKPALFGLHGLWRIWFELGATEQYYPLLHSAFWVEHGLWGQAPMPYHVVNVLLHATAAWLFGLVLQRLLVERVVPNALVRPLGPESALGTTRSTSEPALFSNCWLLSPAWLAALFFAVHPVCVESVAWISEQKNTQSTVFYLLAALVYLHYCEAGDLKPELGLKKGGAAGPSDATGVDPSYSPNGAAGTRRPASAGAPLDPFKFRSHPSSFRYALAFALFVMALLSKSVTATLPAALLVVFWWRRGRLSWKGDVVPLLPFFAIGAASGLFSGWVERTYIGAKGAAFALSFTDRFLLAGRVIWFYLEKLFWPANLIFTYPRWTVDPGVWWQWLFPAAALALAAFLVSVRRRARGPLAAYLFFVGTLFPTIGFLNIFAFYYSYVADHWQYLASLGIFALVASAKAEIKKRKAEIPDGGRSDGSFRFPLSAFRFSEIVATAMICLLGALTFRQCFIYRDKETLYTETIAANPGAWMAHNNLANLFYLAGRYQEAMPHYEEALRLKPDLPEAHNNLGLALMKEGRVPQAMSQFEEAIKCNPEYAEPYDNLGVLLNATDRPAEAIPQFRTVLRLSPGAADVYYNLGNSYAALGNLNEAIACYRESVRLKPDYAPAHSNLGAALAQTGRVPEAVAELREAIRADPGYADAHEILGQILSAVGDSGEGQAQLDEAARLKAGR